MTWSIIVVWVGLVVLWFWWKTGSVAIALDAPGAVATMIEYLVTNGVNRSELRFRVRGDRTRQIVLTKYTDGVITRLRGSVNEHADNRQGFAAIKDALKGQSIPYALKGESRDSKYVEIDFGSDLTVAERVVRLAFSRGFNAEIERDGLAYFKHVITGAVAGPTAEAK